MSYSRMVTGVRPLGALFWEFVICVLCVLMLLVFFIGMLYGILAEVIEPYCGLFVG